MNPPMRPYKTNLTDNSTTLVQTGSTLLGYLNVHNPDASAAHLQLFNAAAAADVTLGTTVPDLSLQIAAGGDREPVLISPILFELGLVIAASVEPQGSTDTGSDMHVYAAIGK